MKTRTDKNGTVWIVDAQGNPVRPAPNGGIGSDPFKVEDQQIKREANQRANAAADRAATAAERANQNSVEANTLARQRFEMELAAKGLMIGPDGQIVQRPGGPVGGKPPADPARVAKLNSLIEQINRTQQLYNEGPGTTSGIYGLADYFPSDANVAFDTSGAQLSEKGLAAFRIPGSGTMTDRDAAMFERANMPTASTRDAGVEEQLRGIRSRVDEELQALGLPAANWTANAPAKKREETPAGAVAGNTPPAGPGFGDPEGDPSGFVPYGSTTRRVNNPEWAGVNEAVKGMIIAGQTPDQIRAYLGQRGINTNVEGLNQAADYFRKTGKRDFRVNVDDIEVPMSGFEQFRNNAPQTAVGAGLTTAANAASFGIPQALAPEQMQYIRDQSPVASFVGDVAGIVGATSGIGAVGNSLARSLAPRALTGGGRFGSAARAVAPDAVYGAAYGGITEGDPLTGAATATLGSAGGQLIGKGLQKGFQGVSDPAVQYLTARGVPLSLGETLGNNSIVGRQMQRMESIPILGDLMSARRGEARDAVYRGVLEDAVQPIGGRIDPADPLASAQQAISGAYDNAVGNVTVPFDARYFDELGNARNAASTLPPDLRGKFDAAMASRVDPLASTISSLPMPSRLNTPRVPTVEEMRNLARVEEIPLSSARAGQAKMAWQEQNSGQFAEPLIEGFADRPVAIRLENGEYIIRDGNHRAVRAFNEGKQTIPAYVIDAKAFDPANAGMRAAQENTSADELLAALDDAGFSPNAASEVPQAVQPRAMTGQQYQQAMRGLSGYKSEATKPGFEQDYRDAISMVQDALKGQMMRGGGDTVVTGLRNADQAYSMLKPIQNATISARGTPTPKQLQAAFTTNTKKFGGDAAAARGDKVPDIVRYAVNNAPNIGNSGTADRLAGIMPFIMPTALGGSAVGLETFTDSPFLTGSLATLAALSTRTGQKAMQTALVKRPAAIRRAGGIFGRRETQKGLAGMVTAPLLIEQ